MGVRTDLEVLASLASRLGRRRRASLPIPSGFEELRRATAGASADYSGITYVSLGAKAARSGRARHGRPDTPRLFLERFATLGWPRPFPVVSSARSPRCLTASTRCTSPPAASCAHYQSGAQTRRVSALSCFGARRRSSSCIRFRLFCTSIAEGDLVRVTSRPRGDRTRSGLSRYPRCHRLHAFPLCRSRSGELSHQPGSRPHFSHLRVPAFLFSHLFFFFFLLIVYLFFSSFSFFLLSLISFISFSLSTFALSTRRSCLPEPRLLSTLDLEAHLSTSSSQLFFSSHLLSIFLYSILFSSSLSALSLSLTSLCASSRTSLAARASSCSSPRAGR